MLVPPIHLGSSSFTADGWQGPFYPKNLKSSDRLSFYSTRFDTVEIDSTFYGTPSPKTVQDWYDQTPPNFLFSLKVPNLITHDKLLEDTDADLAEFLDTAGILKEKLGPLVFQFPFFEKIKLPTQRDFLDLLEPFLAKLPPDKKFAVEIRNKSWLDATFADVLRRHKVALVLQDLSTMPAAHELERKFDPITTDWTYIRWLGDRKWIEGVTVKFDKPVIDRTPQLMRWIDSASKSATAASPSTPTPTTTTPASPPTPSPNSANFGNKKATTLYLNQLRSPPPQMPPIRQIPTSH